MTTSTQNPPSAFPIRKSRHIRRMVAILRVMRILLPLGVFVGIALLLARDTIIGHWIFALSLAGTVGMFTNTIAIKMFFHPIYPTPLGRQGVIPRNKDRIAEAMSAAIERNVLQPDQIVEYIEHHQLIDRGIDWLDKYAIDYLNNTQRREKAVRSLMKQIQLHLPEVTDKTLEWLVDRLKELWRDENLNQEIHQFVVKKAQQFLEAPENRQQFYQFALRTLEQNLPAISLAMQQILENYQEQLAGVKKMVFQITTAALSINSKKIQQTLITSLESPEMRQEIILLVDKSLAYFLDYLDSQETQEFLQQWAEKTRRWIEAEGLQVSSPYVLNYLRKYLQNPETWQWIHMQIDRLSHFVRVSARKYLEDEDRKENIKLVIRTLIVQLNIRNIIERNLKNLPMEKFEEVIMRTTGDQLAWLEILGGILGTIAGLSFIRWQYIFVLPIVLALIWGLEKGLAFLKVSLVKPN